MHHWWFEPASWWQFWLPQSGVAGGLIAGAVFLAAVWMVYWLVWALRVTLSR